jgi:choline transport protein
MLIGIMTGLPIIVAAMIVASDTNALMSSGFPAVELLYQATGNRLLTIFLSVWLILIFACKAPIDSPSSSQMLTLTAAMPPQFVACGRIAWAFARDKGMPYSNYFAHVDSKLEFPARATLAALGFNALYGLLYLASSTAFNSIITSAVLFLNITLAAPQTILVLQRRKLLPERYLKLGYLGWFCNIFATLWIPVLVILVCMPPALPITVASMNYTSPILVGLLTLILVGWFVIGHNFEGPKIDWELLNEGNKMELRGKSH